MLLYLTDDKNRDSLTHILQGGGILLNPFQTYKTEGSPSFAEKLSTAIQTWWIVFFFAPSGAAFVTLILKNHFDLRTLQSSLSGVSRRLLQARAMAIGPTTCSFSHDELYLEVDVTAQRPLSEGSKISSWLTIKELKTIPRRL